MTLPTLAFKWCLLSLIGFVVSSQMAFAEEKSTDWIALNNPNTTQGWTPRGEVELFQAVGSELHLKSKKNVWVTTKFELDNFIFEAEALIPQDDSQGFNSGLAFRCSGKSGKPKGYQCEIESANPGNNGGVYGIGLGGWLYPKAATKTEHKNKISGVFKPDDWNKYRIVCRGPRIQVYVNDVLISDIADSQSLQGYFGIQHHGKGGMVKFRNLRVQQIH